MPKKKHQTVDPHRIMTRRGTIMQPSFTALQPQAAPSVAAAPPASISFVLPPQAPQAPQAPPAATSFAMPQHVSDWITGLYAQQPKPQVAQRSKNEWSHPLLPDVATCHYCVSATACPCFWVHLSADKLLRENGHASDGLSTCYAGLLSGIICAPALFCIDRSATHSLNGMMDRYDDVPAHDDDEEDNFDTIKHSLLAAGGFGTQHEWTNDGKGFDIDDWSEDWWAAGWCGYYCYRSFCCNFLRCRTCNSAPYAPMCFALLCGALYPLCLCPTALVLRRSAISTRNIAETCFDSAARSLFCTPCSLVQTYEEINSTKPVPFTNSMQ